MVLPLTWTVNCEAPITVARMRWPGSTSGNPPRRLSSCAQFTGQQLGDVAELLRLVAEHIFGNTAGERDRGGLRPLEAAARSAAAH